MNKKKRHNSSVYSWPGVLVAALCGLLSCTTGEIAEMPVPARPVEVPLELPLTRSANDGNPENRIVSARMIVFSTGSTPKVIVNKRINPIAESQKNISFRELVPADYLDLYLIINEQSGWNLDTGFPVGSSTATKAALKAKVLS